MSLFDQPLYIIAEVANAAQGVVEENHRIIEAVATTGAKAVKFQFCKYDVLAIPSYPKYENFIKTFIPMKNEPALLRRRKELVKLVWTFRLIFSIIDRGNEKVFENMTRFC